MLDSYLSPQGKLYDQNHCTYQPPAAEEEHRVQKGTEVIDTIVNVSHAPLATEKDCEDCCGCSETLHCVSTCDGNPKISGGVWAFFTTAFLTSAIVTKRVLQDAAATSASAGSWVGCALCGCCLLTDACCAWQEYNDNKGKNIASRREDEPSNSFNEVITQQPSASNNSPRV